MTMREKLIAKVWECGYPDFPLGPDDTDQMGANWATNIIDAILTTLREPDQGMENAACATFSDDPETLFTAMIDHIRDGK